MVKFENVDSFLFWSATIGRLRFDCKDHLPLRLTLPVRANPLFSRFKKERTQAEFTGMRGREVAYMNP